LIEILEFKSDGASPLVRLGCTCGDASLAAYHCEGDQIVYCTNCGDITSREHLHNDTTNVGQSVEWKWENVADRAECPLVNVSIPVRASILAKDETDAQDLAGCVTKISTDRCFVRLEDVPARLLAALQAPRRIARIELTSKTRPLTERTIWDLEEVLHPHGDNGPTYYKLRIKPRSQRRAKQLKEFYQTACGLRFDWQILGYCEQELSSRLRRMLVESLPNARIEIVTHDQEFVRRFAAKQYNLLILAPTEENRRLLNLPGGAAHSPSHRVLGLIKERTAETISQALRWGANDIIHEDCDKDDLRRALQRSLRSKSSGETSGDATGDSGAERLIRPRQRHAARENPNQTPQADLSASDEETIQLLLMASETHDPHTSNHLKRIASYCASVTRCMGWSGERIAQIATASKLHDVGKIGVPDEILRKTGALTKDERRIMQQHTRFGYHVLQAASSSLMRLAANIALRHHERYDGQGYPDGLAGEAIPIEAQIVSIADVFDALTTARPYKAAWTNDETIAYLVDNKEKMFNPAVVAAFLKGMPAIRQCQLAFLDDFRDIWTERRQYPRHPVTTVPIDIEIAVPEQTFRPFRLVGHLCNAGEGGLKVKLTNVTNDLFSMLATTRRYGKLYCEDPVWSELNNVSCEIVWIDYYAVPDPNAMNVGLGFHRTRPNLLDLIQRLAETTVEQAHNLVNPAQAIS
jgi:response regulator RpfG family c-di-GMP phosphodiesterase